MASGIGPGGDWSRQLASTSAVSHRLHVSNIPATLSKDALSNLFSKYGRLVECWVNNNERMGDVTHGTVAYANDFEAATAIKEVDRKPPLNLYVRIKLSQTELEERNRQEQEKLRQGEEQIRRAEAYSKSRGLGPQPFDVDKMVIPLEGRALQLNVS